jgi:hypothetical protein
MTIRKRQCGTVYDRTEHIAVRLEIESFECKFCGATLESWNSAVVPRYRFLLGPVKKALREGK